MASPFANQIQNRNFLSPVGFRFTLAKSPQVAFFSNSARMPGLNLGVTQQPSYLKDLDLPGDKIVYEDFSLRFFVDENLENYMAVHNWITGLGFPESTQQFRDLVVDEASNASPENYNRGYRDDTNQYSDGSLHILNSNFKDVAVVKFMDLFPYSITPLEFSASEMEPNYFTADVSFKYTYYKILDTDGNEL